MKKLLGKVSVDSGCVMITDPCYYVPDGEWDSFVFEHLIDYENDTVKSYAAIPHDLGHEGKAVVSQTRSGDGVYPVFGEYDSNGKLCRIVIEFSS